MASVAWDGMVLHRMALDDMGRHGTVRMAWMAWDGIEWQ